MMIRHAEYGRLEELDDISLHDVEAAQELRKIIFRTNNTNALYQLCLQLLKIGGLEAEIPRLVVFGQQSMGKTTLLDYIMGGPVGFSSTDTGTKQPVVINLRPAARHDSPIECILNGKRLSIQQVQEAMRNIMAEINTIIEEELELIISVPNAVHAVFVDLPGIKDDSKAGADLTRHVVRNYVRNNPNDLYILVKKASDDPANWPWTLREFILSNPPKGLGLTPRQTIVVGTRAKDFLINEKTDVRTHQELYERVAKRAVKDSSGQALPLYLLELFSLSIEEKEKLTFEQKRSVMQKQISEGKYECQELLLRHFEGSRAQVLQELKHSFDVDQFRRALNEKFQNLLDDQLISLERRLLKKQTHLTQQLHLLQVQLTKHDPRAIRELIKLCLRELTQIVTDILTGNYMVIRLPEGGATFLTQFGGTLQDNLREGHELAIELFPDKRAYDVSFLAHIQEIANKVIDKMTSQRNFQKRLRFPSNTTKLEITKAEADPDFSGLLQAGQYVRVKISKDGSQMLGFVESLVQEPARGLPKSASVVFQYVPVEETQQERSQSKIVEVSRLQLLMPLNLLTSAKCVPPNNFRCWKRHLRSDEWIGVIPVIIRSVHLDQNSTSYLEENQTLPLGSSSSGVKPLNGEVVHLKLNTASGDLSGSIQSNEEEIEPLDHFYCDMTDLSLGSSNVFENNSWRFLMRSVKHVIDKADWEPLVADLVQANVQGDLLFLSRLAASATATALLRVCKAAIVELLRLVENGELPSNLALLTRNQHFVHDVEQALVTFCKTQALRCSEAMRDLIFEQTYAIHFEMIGDFFEGCEQFEQDFLETTMMSEVTRRVKSNLFARKQKLSVTDIYNRQVSGISRDMISEEVKIQFWIAKMLLATPLTTKLYMYFIKDIKDKSKHLASDAKSSSSSESDVERVLCEAILYHPNGAVKDNLIAKTDSEINEQYGFQKNINALVSRIDALKRTLEYVRLALESVTHLKSQINQHGNVDFLTKLIFQTKEPSPSIEGKRKSIEHWSWHCVI